MAYIKGQSRSQTSLFPVSLEELISEDHLVHVIDVYVAKLDLVRLEFDKALDELTVTADARATAFTRRK
ncbi:hypothetical protein VM99_05885 [Pseudomonas chlororaphis]|uniref:Transposase n=1 Tax=Pseudomonas chlororaphis TaxID=587753 RepID=A0A0G3G8V3_9PSED|nr:hypothetical protein VM99_05885 [Pseudomonas chlororaphis]